ncbi:hypothetical protein SAMN05216343_10916 [Oscillibacter sp. PC13]|uniref:hypothetical protein n=1 Tax=Oscillibacter sp. PC13 TaxID=1855299 RepID=UPI0008E13AF5|nr:hypothetical protein [Oscillibacter sp. PC13]SFP53791.1 hypothetical protein SAMN05216343_10916 [Oscillibacter sp. PC13]
MEKENFRYSRKWFRLVTLLAIWGILLIPVGLLTKGTPRMVLFCLAAAMLVVAWFVRLRCLTCQGCGKSCAPLMVKKGTTAVCPYCGTPYLFDDGKTGKKPSSKKKH